jgi:hypothetical protein
MGHCEMLLAVAGLSESEILDRTRKLADGTWSAFPPEERVGYAFARKLSLAPASVTAADVAELRSFFGPERTLDVVWWACRCHYMTRVADAFQLPLERENVFANPTQPAPKK